MHELDSAPPDVRLRPFVRAYAQRTVSGEAADIVQPVPASLEHILEFEFRSPPRILYADGNVVDAFPLAVIGSHSMPNARVCLAGQVQSFAIFFEPFGLWQLFGVPNRELVDRSYEAVHLLGSALRDWRNRLAECSSFAERVTLIEQELLHRASRAIGKTGTMNAAVYLMRERGAARIRSLADGSGLSLRHFERRFVESTGLTPKLFARITRFQMAVDCKLLSPQRTWLSIAHEFGYHDQMHMVKDFHALAGSSPVDMFSELGDTRPAALSSSMLEP